MIKPGEEILVGNSGRFRVLDVVPFEEEDELPSIGLLQVEAARPHTRSLLCNGHEWQHKEGDLHGHCQAQAHAVGQRDKRLSTLAAWGCQSRPDSPRSLACRTELRERRSTRRASRLALS